MACRAVCSKKYSGNGKKEAGDRPRPERKPSTRKNQDVVDPTAVRHFKVKMPDMDVFKGSFTSVFPHQAAQQALKAYMKTHHNASSVVFQMLDTTSKRKFTYEGFRESLRTRKLTKRQMRTINRGFVRTINRGFVETLRSLAQELWKRTQRKFIQIEG